MKISGAVGYIGFKYNGSTYTAPPSPPPYAPTFTPPMFSMMDEHISDDLGFVGVVDTEVVDNGQVKDPFTATYDLGLITDPVS